MVVVALQPVPGQLPATGNPVCHGSAAGVEGIVKPTWDELREQQRRALKALPWCPACFKTIYPGEKRHALVNEIGHIECIEIP